MERRNGSESENGVPRLVKFASSWDLGPINSSSMEVSITRAVRGRREQRRLTLTESELEEAFKWCFANLDHKTNGINVRIAAVRIGLTRNNLVSQRSRNQ